MKTSITSSMPTDSHATDSSRIEPSCATAPRRGSGPPLSTSPLDAPSMGQLARWRAWREDLASLTQRGRPHSKSAPLPGLGAMSWSPAVQDEYCSLSRSSATDACTVSLTNTVHERTPSSPRSCQSLVRSHQLTAEEQADWQRGKLRSSVDDDKETSEAMRRAKRRHALREADTMDDLS